MRRTWWFLKNFQKRISRCVVKLFSLFDNEHSSLAFKRSEVRFTFDLSHLVDTQDTFRRHDHSNVAMISPDHLLPIIGVGAGRIVDLENALAATAGSASFELLW